MPAVSHLATIRAVYPRARTTDETVARLLRCFERDFSLSPSQIMHADSTCSDDVNMITYPPQAYEMLGPFKMGGLDGFPFTGLTGMSAFAHHVPVDGAVFVFHAPHIGVTAAGAVGEIHRVGQVGASACCGAARAALGKLQRGELTAQAPDDLDYQQQTLEQILLASADRVLSATAPLIEATEVVYEAAAARIDLLASRTQYPCQHLFLKGGIIINGDHGMGSFCEVRRFIHIDLHTGERTDLMPRLELA